jgi:DNA-binding protein HU-beta
LAAPRGAHRGRFPGARQTSICASAFARLGPLPEGRPTALLDWRRSRTDEEELTLTKADFVDRIAGAFESKKAAADAVDSVLDGITDVLASGGEVNFTGFGKFSVAERGPRQGVNPRTGERITIAGGRVPKFSAGAALKSSVKG